MSVTTQRAGRSRRGRVAIVNGADDTQLARLDSLLAQPAERTANMFEAIGAVAASSAGEPIAAVIVAERFLVAPHARAVEAIKRVDPTVRILGFTESTEIPPTTAAKSIDAWLTWPLRADDLKRVMDDDGLLAQAVLTNTPPTTAVTPSAPAPPPSTGVIELPDDDSDVLTVSPSPVTEPVSMIAAKPAAQGLPTEIVMPATTSAPVAISPSAPAAATASAAAMSHAPSAHDRPAEIALQDRPLAPSSPPTPAAAIGDTDLIQALLHDPAGLAPLALRLIAHHAGWSDVRLNHDLAANQAKPPDGVEVALGTRRFGNLVADHAAPGQLRSWADWLAQWLNVEAEFRQLRQEANTDDLTGACNRRFFERFLTDAIGRARPMRRPVTVMVFDIDNFKPYNDRFGHEAGDDILREIVRLMQSVVRQGDIVCRIGGDEFAVVFADPEAPRTPGSTHPESVESIARRFQQAVCSMRFPKLGQQALGTISVSAGLASFPWDGQDAATLLRLADQRALESKRKGKNALTFGPEITG